MSRALTERGPVVNKLRPQLCVVEKCYRIRKIGPLPQLRAKEKGRTDFPTLLSAANLFSTSNLCTMQASGYAFIAFIFILFFLSFCQAFWRSNLLPSIHLCHPHTYSPSLPVCSFSLYGFCPNQRGYHTRFNFPSRLPIREYVP